MNYQTPGVYVEEISNVPASVAQSETAIPVFIGYTEKENNSRNESIVNHPIRIESMLDYEAIFGQPSLQSFSVTLDSEAPFLPESVQFDQESPFVMHQALNLYFANGGGSCFIVSVGAFTGRVDPIEPDYNKLKSGLDAVEKNDEVTLVVIPEANKLAENDQFSLYKDVLAHCGNRINRFAIFDVRKEDRDASGFRSGIGTSFLDHGAAYYPHLNTSIGFSYEKNGVKFSNGPFTDSTWKNIGIISKVLQLKEGFLKAKNQAEDANSEVPDSGTGALDSFKKEKVLRFFKEGFQGTEKAIDFYNEAKAFLKDNTALDEAELFQNAESMEGFEALISAGSKTQRKDALTSLVAALEVLDSNFGKLIEQIKVETDTTQKDDAEILEFFTSTFTSRLSQLLADKKISMPPSAAIAGAYARVDNDRGVWKSPANISLNRVTGLSTKLTLSENDHLNVHSSGKSINVIRAFTGKGILIWGARTLEGNSNEWRYISVRRFFDMVEDSVKGAAQRFVFEPNNANTWIKVKGMIENFLIIQWRAGALLGAKPEDAFFVNVGLGKTMDQTNINEGKMIVEIGMAAVRPAEFIILRFSHKMLEQ